jgi:hypothetical protein
METKDVHQYDKKRSDESGKLHAAWINFIAHCRELNHGELAKVQIQNGLPISAEHVRKKIKFS